MVLLPLFVGNGLVTLGAEVRHEQENQQSGSEKDDAAKNGPSHDTTVLFCRQHTGDTGGEDPNNHNADQGAYHRGGAAHGDIGHFAILR